MKKATAFVLNAVGVVLFLSAAGVYWLAQKFKGFWRID